MNIVTDIREIIGALLKGDRSLLSQLKTSWKTQLICLGITLAGVGFVMTLAAATGLDAGLLTRDPSDVYAWAPEVQPKPYIGVLSNLGLMLWSASAAICFHGAWRRPAGSVARRFLVASGALTSLLLFDDAFMFHEWLFPKVLHVREYQVYLVYLLSMASYLFVYRRTLLQTTSLTLLIGLVLFAGSMAIDKILPFANDEAAIEDYLKFGALTWWLAYYARVGDELS